MRDRIVRLFKNGVSVPAIAASLDVPMVSVVAVLRASSLAPGEASVVLPELEEGAIEMVLAHYRKGRPALEVASLSGLTVREVMAILHQAGEPIGRLSKAVQREEQGTSRLRYEVLKQYSAGVDVKIICRAYGISRQALRNWRNKAGVPYRTLRTDATKDACWWSLGDLWG